MVGIVAHTTKYNIITLINDYDSFLNSIDKNTAIGISIEELEEGDLLTINILLTGIGKKPDEEVVVACRINDFYVKNSTKLDNKDAARRIRARARGGLDQIGKLFIEKKLHPYYGRWVRVTQEDLTDFLLPFAESDRGVGVKAPTISVKSAEGYKDFYCVPSLEEYGTREVVFKKLDGDELKVYTCHVTMMCASCPTKIMRTLGDYEFPACPYQMKPVLNAACCANWGIYKFEPAIYFKISNQDEPPSCRDGSLPVPVPDQ